MQTIVNLGTGGADLNGQNGSTTSADSNDALFLDWPGDNGGNYVYLPGVTGNYLSVPDNADLEPSGDLDVRVYAALDDWSPATALTLANKYLTTGNQRSWRFVLDTAGRLQFWYSSDGASAAILTSSANLSSVLDGSALWVRVTVDVDNGAAGGDVSFFTSEDGQTWSQLGTTQTTGSPISIFDSSATLNVGGFNAGVEPISGKLYRAQYFDGIDGTTVLDVDCSQITSGADTSFTALTGQTVTINRSASGRKTVAVVSPVWLFGTDDYMQVADSAFLDFDAGGSFSVVMVIRSWGGFTTTAAGLFDRKSGSLSGTKAGYAIYTDAAAGVRFIVGDGTTQDTINFGTITSGAVSVMSAVRDGSALSKSTRVNAAGGDDDTDSVSGGIDAGSVLRIGRLAYYEDFELLSVAVFRRALSAAEITQLSTFYAARWS